MKVSHELGGGPGRLFKHVRHDGFFAKMGSLELSLREKVCQTVTSVGEILPVVELSQQERLGWRKRELLEILGVECGGEGEGEGERERRGRGGGRE